MTRQGGIVQTEFFTWYSSMEFNDDAGVRERRWNNLLSITKAPSDRILEALVRLAFRTKQPPFAAEVTQVRAQLAEDASPVGDDELAMLAASALSLILTKVDATSARTATLIAGVSCVGLRAVKQPMDLVGLAKNTQTELAETSRRRPSLEQQKLVNPQLDIQSALDGLQEGNVATVRTAITALATSSSKALASIFSRQRLFESAVQEYVKVQDEELDILWWLLGRHCTTLNIPFVDVEQEHRPLIFANELAKLTKVLPGPTALPSLLSRAGVDNSVQVTISSAIQALPKEWLSLLLPEDKADKVSAVTTPILEGIRRRQEVGGQDTWIAAWSSVCGIRQDAQLPPLQFAEAAYRELLQFVLG
jgi:hypothetical protein